MLRSLGLLHKLFYRGPFLWEQTFSGTGYHICIILTDYSAHSQSVNLDDTNLTIFPQQDRPNWTYGFMSQI